MTGDELAKHVEELQNAAKSTQTVKSLLRRKASKGGKSEATKRKLEEEYADLLDL